MPIIREPRQGGNGQGVIPTSGGDSIRVICPKCQNRFGIITRPGEVVRCTRCRYPMQKQRDIHQMIEACMQQLNPGQVNNAFNLLKQLSEFSSEACVALNELVNRNTIAMDVLERWHKLIKGYTGGEHSAMDGLNRLCESRYDLYMNTRCRHCGAVKYDVRNPETAVCVYCMRAE